MEVKERFWSKVDIKGPDECWNWKAGKNESGYGHFWLDQHNVKAHRVSWLLSNGDIPDKMCVCHKCDNPSCINPSHLFLGTNNDNVKDRNKKNRQYRAQGERHGRSKLTTAQVIEIRSDARPSKVIAEAYNISNNYVYDLKSKKRWNFV